MYMYKKISAVLFPVAALLLVAAIIWGVQLNRDKQAMIIKAENQYQRAFHDLSFHMDHLNHEIGNALAVNSTSEGFHRRCLINAWRLTSQAQSEIDQLPLHIVQLDKTEEFLSKISKFSYQTAVRDLAKEPMTPEEMKTLKALYQHSREISEELSALQEQVLAKNLQWNQVELAEEGRRKDSSHVLVDGFKSMNQSVSEYEEVDFGPSVATMFKNRKYAQISGRDYSEQEIVQKSLQFLGLPEATPVQVQQNGENSDFSSYSVTITKPDGDIMLDFSKKGGKLIWMHDEREVTGSKLEYTQALEKAQQFLQEHGYGKMKTVNYNEFQHVASITMGSIVGDTIIYPDKVNVMVALDNGDIIGLQAADYIFNHKDRSIEPPKLTLSEARKKINPDLKVSEHSLALIENDLGNEVLCHQFVGKINGNQYRIFINSTTGLEEKIEQLES